MSNKLDSLFEIKDEAVLESHLAVPSREARARFSKVMDRARIYNRDVVITEHGEPVAAVVPISDLKILDWLKKHSSADDIFQVMERSELSSADSEEFRDLIAKFVHSFSVKEQEHERQTNETVDTRSQVAGATGL